MVRARVATRSMSRPEEPAEGPEGIAERGAGRAVARRRLGSGCCCCSPSNFACSSSVARARRRLAWHGSFSAGWGFSSGWGTPCSSKCFAIAEASIVLRSMSPRGPGIPCPRQRACMRTMRRVVEFHRFLMALSVRPGTSLTSIAHLVPCSATASMIARSSSALKPSFFTAGDRWLCQRSRHCLPLRCGRSAAMRLQSLGPPWRSMAAQSISSSSAVQAVFVLRGALASLSSAGVNSPVGVEMPSCAPSSVSALEKALPGSAMVA
mmetsp:Transcript_558/g.1147  ORF Transcript_558/g.1147 Transcript_558/m.1147 type:complete len:265 (-) Transcript_558:129-923(-)